MSRTSVLALALLTGCAARSAPTQTTPPPTAARCADAPVTLRFAWPDDLRAAVTGHDLTESVNDDGSSPLRGDSWADLALVVRTAGPERVVTFETAGRSRMRSQGFAPELAGVRPVVRLDVTGRVVGVDGAREMQEVVRRAAAERQLDEEQAASLLHSTSDASQRGTAAAHWDWILNAWNGRTLSCGEPTRMRVVVPALSFGNATVETETELLYRGRAACERRGGSGCVVLEARQRDIGGSAARAIASSGMGSGATVTGASFVRTIRILAEPDTLVPHRVEFEEHWEIGWQHTRRVTRTILDRQSYAFDYLHPPQPPQQQFIVTREGAPVRRPDTPTCRWVDACCAALGGSIVAQLMCVSIPRDGQTDCTAEDVSVLQGTALTIDGGPPPACTTQP